MLDTPRFHLRPLREEDVSERYLGWLRDASEFISVTTRPAQELADLREYVRARRGRDDVLFLGVFDRHTGMHIGNIKFEPVDPVRGFAVMGILIGDGDYRGKGVAAEVLAVTAGWLRELRNVNQIALGVSVKNQAAIRAYEKVGFARVDTQLIEKSHPDQVVMVWRL